jgi:hypothetical protein
VIPFEMIVLDKLRDRASEVPLPVDAGVGSLR